MRVPGKEDSMSPQWLSTTNWLVTDGSLEGSISFVTSDTEDADAIPIGVLLERPADSPPCEITVSFRERHEIHCVYVRSTARVYEVYYASDGKVSSNEYLCTVRCGAAPQELAADISNTVPNCMNSDSSTSDSHNTMEDGWVEVKASSSHLLDYRKLSMPSTSLENISPRTQIHYEATAEISDANPCMSVTLRLLSLQTKTSIHIDEMYFYTDPVEETDPLPPTRNVGADSLFSMIVPSLLQFSKSGSAQLQDNGSFMEASSVKRNCNGKDNLNRPLMASNKIAAEPDQKGDCNGQENLDRPLVASNKIAAEPDQKGDCNGQENLDRPLVASNKIAADPDQASENQLDKLYIKHNATQASPRAGHLRLADEEKGFCHFKTEMDDEINARTVRLEKTLDDLVLRLGKIENFCSNFQEGIAKPLAGIELRLQRIEEKLDIYSKVSFPFDSDETNPSTNNGCNSSFAEVNSSSHEKEAAADMFMAPLLGSEKSSGLVLKAPDFLNDDDDDDDNDDEPLSITVYSSDLAPNKCTKYGKGLSIDRALASALEAFVTSSIDMSSLHNSHPMIDMHNEPQNCSYRLSDFVTVADHLGTSLNSVPELVSGDDKNCDGSFEAQGEVHLGESFFSDAVNPEGTSYRIDMSDGTEEKVLGDFLCDKFPAEIATQRSKCIVFRAPDFLNDDDVLNCGEDSDHHTCSFPTSEAPLSSRVSPSDGTLNLNEELLNNSSRCKFEASCSSLSSNFDGILKSYFFSNGKECQSSDDLTGNAIFPVDKNLAGSLPLEILLGKNSAEQMDNNSECSNIKLGMEHKLPVIESFSPNCELSELSDGNLLDLEDNAVQSEVSNMVKVVNPPQPPVCFSCDVPFSSLI